MQPCIDVIFSKDRPNAPALSNPALSELQSELIIGNLTYIEVIINRILENVKNVQKQLGNANIEFRLNFNDTYINNIDDFDFDKEVR